MATTVDSQVPGTILARNKETGVLFRIRPDMLKIVGNPWVLVSDTELPTEKPAKELSKEEKRKLKYSDDRERPDIILKNDGTPFASRVAAANSIRLKRIPKDKFAVEEYEDGFAIVKIKKDKDKDKDKDK